MPDINELLDDIRKIRNDLVAQSNPHFQTLTNLIYKWEMKLVEMIKWMTEQKFKIPIIGIDQPKQPW